MNFPVNSEHAESFTVYNEHHSVTSKVQVHIALHNSVYNPGGGDLRK